MFRKVGLFCMGALLATQVFAAPQYIGAGREINYDLEPNVVISLINKTFLDVRGTCHITTEEPSAIIHVHMIQSHAEIDGELLDAKDNKDKDLYVQNGSAFYIHMPPTAGADLVNKGQKTMKVHCVAAG